jgi:hypothetical protein
MIKFKLATQELAEKYYGEKPQISFRGIVAVKDGEPIAIGGAYRVGKAWYAFSEMKDEMRKHKKAIVKGIQLLEAFYDSLGYPVLAVVSKDEPTAPGLLAKLGFEPKNVQTENGENIVVRSPLCKQFLYHSEKH